MPTPIPAGFGRVAISFSTVGATRQSVITFGITDGDPAQTPMAIATEIRTGWLAHFVPEALATTWSLAGVRVALQRPGGLAVGEDLTIAAGTAAFNAMSLAVSALLKKSSGMGGRRFRGRCYLPAGYLGELSVSPNGTIDTALVNATTTRWQGFINRLLVDGSQMVLLHEAALDGTVAAPTPVVSGSCEPTVATQRRRQRR